jgi:hypothetical protein
VTSKAQAGHPLYQSKAISTDSNPTKLATTAVVRRREELFLTIPPGGELIFGGCGTTDEAHFRQDEGQPRASSPRSGKKTLPRLPKMAAFCPIISSVSGNWPKLQKSEKSGFP